MGQNLRNSHTPQPLRSKPSPFDHPDWLYELKYDGFRAVAQIKDGRCQLISRNGSTFTSFSTLANNIAFSMLTGNAILDGEIVCLDSRGHPKFRDLLFHRGDPCFFAFDLLAYEGKDLRLNALVERKAELRRILARISRNSRVRYAEHIEDRGSALFEKVCELDLEGVTSGEEDQLSKSL